MMQELNYICCGDYYIPDIHLPEESRSIGRWGRMHRDYIKEHRPILFNDLCLNGNLWTYLANLNEQAQNRLEFIIEQMKVSEGVTEDMKQHAELIEKGGFSANIITRLKRDNYVALDSIEKICYALDCGVDDILEFIPDEKEQKRHD